MLTMKEIDKNRFRVSIKELKLWEGNYKTIERAAIDKLKKSLLEDGQLHAIKVDARPEHMGVIIDGNARYLAIMELIEEEKWPYGDMVWIDPIEPENDGHSIALSYKANAQYGKADKQKTAEHAVFMDEMDILLSEIPFAAEGKDYTLLDVLDEFSPSGEDPVEDIEDVGEKRRKTITCPNCSHEFER